MNDASRTKLTSMAAALLALAACQTAPPAVAPAPARTSRPPAARTTTAPPWTTTAPFRASRSQRPPITPADVAFMQGMIVHHAQAILMARLVPDRTTNPDVRRLAQKIDISQRDEIILMQHWLADRHLRVIQPDTLPRALAAYQRAMAGLPDSAAPRGTSSMSGMPGMSGMAAAAHSPEDTAPISAGSPALMPGMLTPAQLDRLAAAQGTRFDRLFLEGMIGHHGGAITMVEHLFATPGAAQEPEIFGFATDVDTSQRIEITRMRALLKALPPA